MCIAVKKKMRASPRSSAPSRRMDSSLARRRVRFKIAQVITDVAGRQIRPSRRRSRRRRGRHTSPARRIGARGDRVRCQPIANERARGGRSGPGVRGRSAAPHDDPVWGAIRDHARRDQECGMSRGRGPGGGSSEKSGRCPCRNSRGKLRGRVVVSELPRDLRSDTSWSTSWSRGFRGI